MVIWNMSKLSFWINMVIKGLLADVTQNINANIILATGFIC
jgi:hypothetical protein